MHFYEHNFPTITNYCFVSLNYISVYKAAHCFHNKWVIFQSILNIRKQLETPFRTHKVKKTALSFLIKRQMLYVAIGKRYNKRLDFLRNSFYQLLNIYQRSSENDLPFILEHQQNYSGCGVLFSFISSFSESSRESSE